MASVSEFVVRADAGPGIGLGHMMRCLPAAQELLRAGSRVTFAVRNDESLKILEQVLPQFPIAAEQMERVCLSGMKAKSGEAACDTAAALAELAAEHSASAVLLDTYAVDPQSMLRLKKALHQSGTSLWYLDDLLAFPYPADGLINYSFYADRAAYEKLYQESDQNVTCPELLLGPSYVPLREEFRGKREVSEKTEDSLPTVLLLTGGTDPCHVLAALLEVLKDAFEVTAVIGAMNPDREQLIRQYQGCGTVRLLTDVRNLSEWMSRSDYAVTAAGVTIYELCAAGTLFLTYTLADNQLPNAHRCDEMGLAAYLGDAREGMDGRDPVAKHALEKLKEMTQLPENERQGRRNRMQELIDGEGAARIAQALRRGLT